MKQEYKEVLKSYLGKSVKVVIDRPLGSHHPKHPNMIYPVNYGYITDLAAPDGMGQDVYLLGVNEPVESFECVVIAIIERLDDVEDKLVAVPKGVSYSNEEIEQILHFQEQYFKHRIIR